MTHQEEPGLLADFFEIELLSKPLSYDDVVIAGNLNRLEYKQLAETVYNYRPFTLPPESHGWYTESHGWYTAAVIDVRMDGDYKAYAMTCFTGKCLSSGNIIALEREWEGWKVVWVDTWAK